MSSRAKYKRTPLKYQYSTVSGGRGRERERGGIHTVHSKSKVLNCFAPKHGFGHSFVVEHTPEGHKFNPEYLQVEGVQVKRGMKNHGLRPWRATINQSRQNRPGWTNGLTWGQTGSYVPLVWRNSLIDSAPTRAKAEDENYLVAWPFSSMEKRAVSPRYSTCFEYRSPQHQFPTSQIRGNFRHQGRGTLINNLTFFLLHHISRVAIQNIPDQLKHFQKGILFALNDWDTHMTYLMEEGMGMPYLLLINTL